MPVCLAFLAKAHLKAPLARFARMTGGSTVPLAGLLLGITAMVLIDPFFPDSNWWAPALIAAGFAAASAYVISHGVNALPGASPRLVAGLTTALLIGSAAAAVIPLLPKLSDFQSITVAAAPFALFRLVVWSVDRFTPSFTVSLLAGGAGMVLFAGAVPLLAFGNPDLSPWTCLGIAAAIAYAEGVLIGTFLRPLFSSATPPAR
jgi:hypothetical protein